MTHMLPAAYQVPAALILLAGGLLACFAGFRLFKLVLGLYGFILGALIATSIAGADETVWTIVAAVAGGVLGAAALILAYFAGVALLGAGAASMLLHVAFSSMDREPHLFLVIAAAVAGAIAAMLLQKYVIVLTTAFGGAWTAIVGGFALAGNRAAVAATEIGDVWVAYPLNPAPGERWAIAAWLAMGIAGAVVQLRVTAKKR
jgi:hypothetical protein